MTDNEIKTLVKSSVVDSLHEFFSDPDLGKTLKKSFIKSIEKARNEKGRSLTLAQFRRKYSF